MTTTLVHLSAALRAIAAAVAVGLASPMSLSAQTETATDTNIVSCLVPQSDTLNGERSDRCASAPVVEITSTQAGQTPTRLRARFGRLVRLVQRVARVVRVKQVRPARRVPRILPSPKVRGAR